MDIGFLDWKIKNEIKNESIRQDYVNTYGSDVSCPNSIRNNMFNPNSGNFTFKDDPVNNSNNGFNW